MLRRLVQLLPGFILLLSGHHCWNGDTTSKSYILDQRRLLTTLFDNKYYDKRIRPVRHHRTPVNVTIRLNLYQLVDVSERNQNVVLYSWMTQMWRDQLLIWDPTLYGNLTSIVVPFNDIWLPDTYLYNNLQMVREDSERWISIILESEEGRPDSTLVTFRYPAIFKFTCHMNVRYFPFDKQFCTMVFGSWTYDAVGITFKPETENVAREDFTENEEWTVISFKSNSSLVKYDCCLEPFSLLYVHLTIQRKPLHYLVNLMLPTLVVSLISNVGFFTASSTSDERTEKVSLGISTLLAFAILLLMISDQMPITSSSVPLIGSFLLAIMLQTAVATLASSIILSIEKRGHYNHRVPPLVKRIFLGKLASLVGCSFDWQTTVLQLSRKLSGADRHNDCSGTFYENSLNNLKQSATASTDLVRPESEEIKDREYLPLLWNAEIKRVHETINNLSAQLVKTQKSDNITRLEWEWLAAVLDRICLIVSLTSVLSLGLGILVIGYWNMTLSKS